ncbi:hypothetical protein V9T40_013110 [Parthenolecanium corni]|uniref:Uncharacterized protein n=1 Tax=Parthenolecanium corni TaxID=536013 RepID=A0AAN9TIH5_9HEMI
MKKRRKADGTDLSDKLLPVPPSCSLQVQKSAHDSAKMRFSPFFSSSPPLRLSASLLLRKLHNFFYPDDSSFYFSSA